MGAAGDETDVLGCLAHRGPDSAGWYRAGGAHIGQNRLAIIDLVTGDPPITNEDGSIGVALNGEIYNFARLREDLEGRGHRLRTTGDTEVIAHLAEELAPVELARALEGMFAFALYDQTRDRLILGRDRFGKKPLYYWAGPSQLVFGSEIKAVLARKGVPRRLDPGAIPAYLTFGYVPTPRTFFEGIRSVPPGHVLVRETDGQARIERYWRSPLPTGDDALELDMEEAARETRSRLRTAVTRRLVGDVPVGAFLSGGIDSSAVVGLMAEQVEDPIRTFTIGFEAEDWVDERPFAALVAKRFRTQHEEFLVKPSAVDLIERLVWHHDQPFGDSSAVPTYVLSELTGRHVKVALAGDGGDELFAGYERFAAGLLAARYRQVPEPARRLMETALQRLPRDRLRGRVGSVGRFAEHAADGLPGAYLSWLSYVPEPWRAELLADPDNWALDDYQAVWTESEGAPLLHRLLDLNLKTYLLDDLLPKMDRMSMAHGLEVRSPFLDPELASYAMSLAPSLKARGLRLKRVLKEATKDLLPPEVVGRRKKGFGVPLDRWFRGDLAGYVKSKLGLPGARVRAHLDGAALDRLLAEHKSGARDHGNAVWALLTLEVFLEREGW